ncbi:MAG: translocation/assembly module TamB domain-containing protein [Candidatus Acidiferrales bacterium]
MSARWVRWTRRVLIAIAVVAAGVVLLFASGLAERGIRREIVAQIEQRTGARVEMGAFHFQVWRLRAEIDNLTLHGLEDPAAPPLFHADRIDVGIRVLSFFGRKVALDSLIVERPEVAVRVDANGRSNVPSPKVHASKRPWQQTLFQLQIGDLELRDGSASYNNQRIPLTAAGRNFEFVLHYEAPANAGDLYAGSFQWQQVELAAQRYRPVRFDLSAKFTLHRDAFELDELVWKGPHSEVNVRADLPSFARADWDLRYRGRLALEDIRTIFRKPTTPDGIADFSGRAHYTPGSGGASSTEGEWTASGYYNAHDVDMPYEWFHARGLETSGDYEVAKGRLVVPNLKAQAAGGVLDGRLEMNFKGLAFHTETHMHGAGLADILAAIDHEKFPVNALHWDASVDIDSVNTWNAAFKHFRTGGTMQWSPTPGANTIPVTAHFQYDYGTDQQIVTITQSQIATPTAQLDVDGALAKLDSALEVKFSAKRLLDWDDFINAIRGPDAEPRRIEGRATWRGRVLGPIVGPTFFGHMEAADAQYDKLAWDEMKGDFEYSPDGFRLTKAMARRGQASATLELALDFDHDWGFPDSSSWRLDACVEGAPSDDLQSLLGTNFPVKGSLSGDLHGGGTRGDPAVDANFVFSNIQASGWHFDSLTGHLHWQHDEVRLSHAQLRDKSALLAGDFSYRPSEERAEFDLTGSGIALEKIRKLQTESLPIAGLLGFHLEGSGPVRAPVAQADVRLTNLKLGTEVEGDFTARLESDGRNVRIALGSEPAPEKLQGELTVSLAGDDPIAGRLSVKNFDLDPLIVAALHTKGLTGHSSADGVFTISGALRQPDSIEVDADIARLAFNYELVQLTNDQNIRLTYRRNEVRVDQARLHGPDTDLQFSGSARFDRDRPLRLALAGSVNLRLVKGLLPDLNANGRADLNVSVEGTMAQPSITGRAGVRDASATYGDFPVGLSKLNGDFVFDKSRLVFDRVTAEAGGGQLTLSGHVAYGEGPLRYEVTAATSQLRIRYPAGMSWLAGGTLQLSGTSNAGLISGHVQVERLLFAQGVDVASLFAAAAETSPGPPSSSPFLQNLAFDVEGQTNPGARIEWTGAHVEMDGDVRLRGTFDRPVLLGNIHLLSGEMPFRGNTFEITRGDINFANPFRLDPELDVEATSTISQYQVTIDFSGKASHLSMNYRSDPPLPDSDIVALLALGSPGQGSALRSSPGASQNYGATALLSEAISSGIGGRIEHLFGISSFRVDPFVAGTATESNAAARVTIQQQVTRGLTITYSTNAATSNQYQLIQVEYALRRTLSVIFLRDINGTYGLDIKWVKHFK